MAQFIGKATTYLPYGSVRLFAPPRGSDCGVNQRFCQPTEQTDDITFQFLAAETSDLITDGDFPDGSHNSDCGIASWCGQGWGIVDNAIVHLTPTQPNFLTQDSIFTLDGYFRITFTVTDMTAGNLTTFNLGDASFIGSVISTNGDYTFLYISTSNGALSFSPTLNFDGAISNVSVVQIARSSDYSIAIHDVETGINVADVPAENITGSTGNNVITVDFNWTDDLSVTNGCRDIRISLINNILFEDDFSSNQGWNLFGGVTIDGGRMNSSVSDFPWSVGTLSFLQLFSVAGQEGSPHGLFFKPDGTKMYIIGIGGVEVNEYDLSVAWDISTAVFLQLFSVAGQEAFPSGIFFREDGEKMYIIGVGGVEVNEYDLGTAWDISSAVFLQLFSVVGEEAIPQGLFFKSDGRKMFIIGSGGGGEVNEYDLSTAWDISTAVFLQLFSVVGQETIPMGVFFKADGRKMFIIGINGVEVNEYDLSTAWDISSAVFLQLFSVAGEEANPTGLFFRADGQKMYITGTGGVEVNEYDLGTGFPKNFANLINTVLEVGTEYTVTYEVISIPGQVQMRLGNNLGTLRTATGTFTENLICTQIPQIRFDFPSFIGNVVIDNVVITKVDNMDGQSECFDLQTSHDCSFMWVWSNDNRWGSYDYRIVIGGGILNFQHKLRVICKFRGVKYPNESNIGEDSAGLKTVDYFSLRKIKLLDIDFIPDYLHDAIAAFWSHDNRTINGTSFIMVDEYEPSAPNPSKNLFKDLMNVTIEIEETSQPNLINRNE